MYHSPKGASFIEVLISLGIFSFSSMALFQYQFQTTKTYQSQNRSLHAQQFLNDLSEIMLEDFSFPSLLEKQIKDELGGTFSFSNKAEANYVALTYPSAKEIKRFL